MMGISEVLTLIVCGRSDVHKIKQHYKGFHPNRRRQIDNYEYCEGSKVYLHTLEAVSLEAVSVAIHPPARRGIVIASGHFRAFRFSHFTMI